MASNVLLQDKKLVKNVIKATFSKAEFLIGTHKKSFSTSNKNDKQYSYNKYSLERSGTGGRSSFSGRVATVFGASGVVGRLLVNRLGKEGTQIIAPHRCDDMYMRPLKLCGDLGQIQFMPLDIQNEDTIRNALKHSSLVINCIGNDWETTNWSFEQVHIEAARKIAKMARECGVEKLIHFSSLNASPEPQKIYLKNGSKFLKTKYEGELAVKSEFPKAVIIRPSNIYGEGDRFIYFYIDKYRRQLFKRIALWNKGEKTIKMPVHQIDVANGIMEIIRNPHIYGKTYDFVGQNRYLLSDLVDFIMSIVRRNEVRRTNMSFDYLLIVKLFEMMPTEKFYNHETLEREFISDVITPENDQLSDLGIKFKKLEEMLPWHLRVYNKFASYDESLGEFPAPIPPIPLQDDFVIHERY